MNGPIDRVEVHDDSSLGTLAACAICASIAASVNSFTKSPFQYPLHPFRAEAIKQLCNAVNGIGRQVEIGSEVPRNGCIGRLAFSCAPA